MQQLANIALGALHGGEPAGVFAGQRFGVGANNETNTCSRIKACGVGQPCPVGPAVASKAMLGDELVEFSAEVDKPFTRQVLDFLLA